MLLGRLLHILRIHQVCSRGFLLPCRVEKPVISLRNVIDQLPVNVVKGEVRSEEACPFRIDSAAPRSEIEDRVVQIERDLEVWDCLGIEPGTQCCVLAINARYGNGRQRWK